MSEVAKPFPVIREAVASFPDREHFRTAVSALLSAGFERTDLSVLASHVTAHRFTRYFAALT